MAKELASIDISGMPDVLRLAQEVSAAGEARVLSREDEPLAVLTPVRRRRRRSRARKTGMLTEDDALWNIVGIGRSLGPTDVSANKYKYLAQVYDARGR